MEILLDSHGSDFRFQHPFNCIISGSSGSGKTTLLIEILLGGLKTINVKFDRIVYCYGEYLTETFEILKNSDLNVEFIEGLPTEDKIRAFTADQNNCLILDDLMVECSESKEICNYFSRTAHHKNISIFFLTQNFYQKGKYATTITRNSSYIILFASPRDFGQIKYFASQSFNPKALLHAYNLATRMPRGYLLIDCTQNTPDKFRLRSNIIPPEETVIFVPKK